MVHDLCKDPSAHPCNSIVNPSNQTKKALLHSVPKWPTSCNERAGVTYPVPCNAESHRNNKWKSKKIINEQKLYKRQKKILS